MRLIDADSVLNGIEELKKSPWFNRGKEIVKGDPGFQHIGYIERKEAIEVVRDLCIRKEPTIGGWISAKDRLPDDASDVLAYYDSGCETRIAPVNYYKGVWYDCVFNCPLDTLGQQKITHWMPLPEPPKEETDANFV